MTAMRSPMDRRVVELTSSFTFHRSVAPSLSFITQTSSFVLSLLASFLDGRISPNVCAPSLCALFLGRMWLRRSVFILPTFQSFRLVCFEDLPEVRKADPILLLPNDD
jgi:hypothetical protein